MNLLGFGIAYPPVYFVGWILAKIFNFKDNLGVTEQTWGLAFIIFFVPSLFAILFGGFYLSRMIFKLFYIHVFKWSKEKAHDVFINDNTPAEWKGP
jgi:hypothetical protein